ncbi:MAG: hypothetical protein FWC94_05135 [Bacteroidales bacterium]|nr:hypothetical protein [Bacteroidales bacterium]
MSIENNELLIGIVSLATAFVVWVAKTWYDKHISIRPRLFLSVTNPGYASHIRGGSSVFTWKCYCTLKNNSEYTAYDVEIFEAVATKTEFIFNVAEIRNKLPKNNHIDAKESQNFLVALQRTCHNGSKYLPAPNELNNIRLIVKYRNEKGRLFYTKYYKKDGQEKNKQCFSKPFKHDKKQLLNNLPNPK